jgi:hypothetical protein
MNSELTIWRHKPEMVCRMYVHRGTTTNEAKCVGVLLTATGKWTAFWPLNNFWPSLAAYFSTNFFVDNLSSN